MNRRRALRACREVLAAGHAPFAPHLLYTAILNDNIESERAQGIGAGHAWIDVCHELWVWGFDVYEQVQSAGMCQDIARAQRVTVPVFYQGVPEWWNSPHP